RVADQLLVGLEPQKRSPPLEAYSTGVCERGSFHQCQLMRSGGMPPQPADLLCIHVSGRQSCDFFGKSSGFWRGSSYPHARGGIRTPTSVRTVGFKPTAYTVPPPGPGPPRTLSPRHAVTALAKPRGDPAGGPRKRQFSPRQQFVHKRPCAWAKHHPLLASVLN